MNYLEQLFSLKDKKIVITGGSGAIASSMAEALTKAGATVILWDLHLAALEAQAAKLPGSHYVQVDALDEEKVEQAIIETEKTAGGPPDVLINGVGGNKGKSSFTELDVKVFEEVIRLNLLAGLVIPTKLMTKYWIEKGIRGSIINIASMASYIPLSGIWAYNAAKSAVINLTVATAKEFAPKGIRVNAIAPGFFIGKQNKALLIANDKTGELTPRGKDVIKHTPFGRFGDVKEINGTIIMLASSAASGFMTGVTIPVDGGYLTDNI